ncbi:MAG: hypothetical protein P8Y49_04830 [Sulfurovaceae bacterium]
MLMVKKGLLYTLLVLFLLFWFAPYEKFFYTMQHHLATKNIYLHYDNLSSKWWGGLAMENFEVSRGNNIIFQAKQFEIFPFFVSLNASANESNLYEQFAKIEAKEAKLSWSIFSINEIDINAQGNFGTIEGSFSLLDTKLKLRFASDDNIEYLKSFLKEDNNGWYYEKAF